MNKERKEKHFLHKPQYKGGVAAIKEFITQQLQYPKEAFEANVEGTVSLRYDINHKGVVTDAKVISGVGHGCDKEAIRLVKLLKFQIAKNRGVRAVFHKNIKIHFRMPKKKKAVPTTPPPTGRRVQYNYTTTNQKNEKTVQQKTANYSYTVNLKAK